jgi:CubicO group peptidase (beta-lactamase class C family)
MSPELSRRLLGRAALSAMTVAGTTLPADADGTRDRVGSILPDLVAKLQEGMAPWHVPGAAIAVVVGQDVVLARGFGVRRVDAAEPVDADTVFQIGSATKAFAATTEAILVDQGKLRWMDRVIDHDPEFRMLDPWVTREFRIIDLLAQRTGLRPYVLDVLWILGYSAEDIAAGLRHVRPVSSFRTEFAYQNIVHQVAGRIVAKLAGVPRWQDAVSRLILEPLGMSSTTASAEALLATPNHATGHTFHGNKLTALPPLASFPYATGPAGCLNSCLTDMAAWLRFLIGRGEHGGQRLLGAHTLETTWKPRVEVKPGDDFPWVWQAYASGWVVRQTERGLAIWHNGGTQQFTSHVGFVPALGVGIVVLTNEGTNQLADAIALWFYDRLLGNEPEDYSTQALSRSQQHAEKQAAKDRRPSDPAPPRPAGDYTGDYRSQIAGLVRVGSGEGNGLTLSFETPGTHFGLTPWDSDVFALTSPDPTLAAFFATNSPMLVQFRRTAHGEVNTMGFDGEEDIAFRRMDASSSDR